MRNEPIELTLSNEPTKLATTIVKGLGDIDVMPLLRYLDVHSVDELDRLRG